jgi:hypothetical protein
MFGKVLKNMMRSIEQLVYLIKFGMKTHCLFSPMIFGGSLEDGRGMDG